MSNQTSEEDNTGGVMRRLVERTIQRNINGVNYFLSSYPPVGLTPHNIIHKRGPLSLIHYTPQADELYRTPVLIVAPTTNRGYCLDMMPGVSFVEFMLKNGYDVFMIDFEPPRPEDSSLTLSDYAQFFIEESIAIIGNQTSEPDITLIGYCMGGVLSSIYCAANPDANVRNLVCFTTPIDFSNMDMFNKISDERHFDVDRMVDLIGNVPPNFVLAAFQTTDPAGKTASRIRLMRDMWDADHVENFRKYDRWANDMMPLAGEYFRETVKELLWKNAFYKGTLKLNGRPAKLDNIKMPVFHAIAQHDNLIPYEASRALIESVGSKDKTELVLKGGHVSLVCGANAVGRMWPALDLWLAEKSV